jgi:hypothetical protein
LVNSIPAEKKVKRETLLEVYQSCVDCGLITITADDNLSQLVEATSLQ